MTMTLTALGPHTIVVLRAGRKPSDYGTTTIPDWDNATETTVTGCSVQPVIGDEYTADRNTTRVQWVAYVPAGVDVESTDRVIFDGHTYELDGDPMIWSFGQLSHLVLSLRRTEED